MEKKLERNEHNKMIAGVASGLADYLFVDVIIIRIAFILLAVFGFSGVLIYIIMWVAIPEKSFLQNYPNFDTDYKVQDESQKPYTAYAPPINPPVVPVKKNYNSQMIVGLILIAIGSYFMLNELNIIPYWFSIYKLWPVIIIVLGLIILFKPSKKKVFDHKEPFSNTGVTSSNTGNSTNDQPLT